LLIEKALNARNGGKFARLWSGDIRGYSSHSEPDAALCELLAFWTQDPAQIDRLFRRSALMRDKWDEQRGEYSYGARTITFALAQQQEHWQPRDRTGTATEPQDRRGTDHGEGPRHAHAENNSAMSIIRLSTNLTGMVDSTQNAILVLPGGPYLFQRARQLSRSTMLGEKIGSQHSPRPM
jgi:primase-polymerase (primpol)-like protein